MYPTKHGIRLITETRITPTLSGRDPGLIEARVWPPRITHVVENPSLATTSLVGKRAEN